MGTIVIDLIDSINDYESDETQRTLRETTILNTLYNQLGINERERI